MKKIISTLFLLVSCLGYSNEDVSIYLNQRIPSDNPRYSTFSDALKLMSQRNVTTIVETGTARCGDENFEGDGGSTIIFGDWAKNHNVNMYSVDINPLHIALAKKASTKYLSNLQFVTGDSVKFLDDFPGKIDFLYLDSWDYDVNDPLSAQTHCLKEVKAAYEKLSKKAIIMIDDCNIQFGGKGLLAIKFLKKQKWKLYRNNHQVIMIRRRS